MNSEEEKSKKKKIILILLLLLLFLIAFGLIVLFLNDDGTAEAVMYDQSVENSISSENNNNEVIVTNEETNKAENEIVVIKTSSSKKKTNTIHQTKKKDTISPTIKGIMDNTWYAMSVSATISDDSSYTATLIDDQENKTPYQSGTLITKEGHYTLEVVDENGNKTVYEFGIDTTKPNVSNIIRYSSKDVTPVVEDLSQIVATLNGKNYTIGTPITKEGYYQLVITDAAGNQTEIEFTIDKIAPIVEEIPEIGFVGEDFNINVTEANLDSIVILKYGASEEEYPKTVENGYTITEEGFYIIEVTDKAGNTIRVNLGIDKTAPIILGVKDGAYYNTAVRPNIQELKVSGEILLNGELFSNGTEIDEEGEYTLEVTDVLGRATIVHFVIDKTKPAVQSIEVSNKDKQESEYIKNGETVKVEATFTEKLTVAPTLTIGDQTTTFEKEGETFVAEITIPAIEATLKEGLLEFSISDYADQAGNVGDTVTQTKASKNITYDRTVPTITIKPSTLKGTDGVYSYIDLVISDNFGIDYALINGKRHELDSAAGQAKGLTFNTKAVRNDYVEGKNTVVVVDKAGNKVTFTFVLDTKKPAVTMFRMQNFYNPAKNQNYAKLGDKIAITVVTSEPLLGKPQIEIGGKTFTIPVQEAQFNKYVVYVELTSDMKLTENEKITAKIKNIVDLAENEAEPKEIISTGDEEYYVIFDKTKPSVSFDNLDEKEYLVGNQKISVSDQNSYTLTIKDKEKTIKGPETGTKRGEKYTSSIDASEFEDGTYTVEVMDIAGNVTTKIFKIDDTDPEIVSIGGTTGNKYWKQTYEFSVKIAEKNIDSVYYAWNKSNNENSMKNALKESNATKVAKEDMMDNGDGTYTLKIKADKEGSYVFNIKVVDEVGHTVSKRKAWYKIDNTAPSLKVGETEYGPETENEINTTTRDFATVTAVDSLSGISKIYIDGDVNEKIELAEEGTHTIKLVDKAGNESEFTVIINNATL